MLKYHQFTLFISEWLSNLDVRFLITFFFVGWLVDIIYLFRILCLKKVNCYIFELWVWETIVVIMRLDTKGRRKKRCIFLNYFLCKAIVYQTKDPPYVDILSSFLLFFSLYFSFLSIVYNTNATPSSI